MFGLNNGGEGNWGIGGYLSPSSGGPSQLVPFVPGRDPIAQAAKLLRQAGTGKQVTNHGLADANRAGQQLGCCS
jgi:hypothetical protein